VGITGVSDPDDIATIVIDRVTQDEPTSGLGGGDTAVDAIVNADGTVLLRAERAGGGDGRVYHVHFTASDLGGSASGMVTVCVPHDRNTSPIDGGELFESTD
jgi:chitinase